jgi:predicted alpha/beta-hydrolase family hydrolase
MTDAAPQEFAIDIDVAGTTALLYSSAGPEGPALRTASAPPRVSSCLVLAHGAGAGQRHPFMTTMAQGLSARGIDVVTFNFLYMEQRRRVPDRMPQLVACYRAVTDAARKEIASARERLFIGGKSMGGRAATHVAAEDSSLAIEGIVLLGYPLHPPGRPDQLRDTHLPAVERPMLFVQGSRDTFGTPTELKPILASLTPLPKLHTVDGGDHSFKIAGRDAKARQAEVYRDVQATIVEWIAACT